MVLACFASLPNYIPYLQHHGLGAITFDFFVLAAPLQFVYGVIPTALFLAGFYLVMRGKPKIAHRPEVLSILAATVALFLIIMAFTNFSFNIVIPYQRVYVPLFMLMSIIASMGYVHILRLSKSKSARNGMVLIFSVLVIATILLSSYRNLNTPYYHAINAQDYQNFLYIQSHFNSSELTIMNPIKAKAFTPITGMHVYSVEPFGPSATEDPLLNNTSNFFAANCTNTQFLLQNNISIIYYPKGKCDNANLTEVSNGIYAVIKP
jgi:hypothetical protein